MSLICMRIKNHFHTKAFALTQALNQRLGALLGKWRLCHFRNEEETGPS